MTQRCTLCNRLVFGGYPRRRSWEPTTREIFQNRARRSLSEAGVWARTRTLDLVANRIHTHKCTYTYTFIHRCGVMKTPISMSPGLLLSYGPRSRRRRLPDTHTRYLLCSKLKTPRPKPVVAGCQCSVVPPPVRVLYATYCFHGAYTYRRIRRRKKNPHTFFW